MGIGVYLVGIGGWYDYTLPAIESVRRYNRSDKVDILVIDNGNQYSILDSTYKSWAFNRVGLLPFLSYAGALNVAHRWSQTTKNEWSIFTNNDVLCTGDLTEFVDGLDKDVLYGDFFHPKSHEFIIREPWLDGWIYVMHRDLLTTVGEWDENFKTACFEDADYSWRAVDKGYKLKLADIPFRHLEVSGRAKSATFLEERKDNIRYLCGKYGLKIKKI